MLNRVMQIGFATIVAMTFAGVAQAQDEEAPVEGEAPADTTDVDGDGVPDSTDGAPTDGTDDGAADMDGDGANEGTAEGGGAKHGLVLPKGGISLHVGLEINMSTDAVGKPFSIAPDVWYGVNEKLSAGIVHSVYGRTGFWDGYRSSLCLAGEENGCAKVYDNIGVAGKYALSQTADMGLAAIGGLHVNSFDPMLLALRVGVEGMWTSGKMAVHFVPSLQIGLTEREPEAATPGIAVSANKEVLAIPVSLMYAASHQLHAGVQTGIRGPLDGFGDAYSVPLSLGAIYMVNPQIMVGGAFGFNRILGAELPEGVSAMDFRALNIFFGWKK